jgi:hypothetical protein
VIDRDRDRDSAGRPRSARPRDATGRPLPYGSPAAPRAPDDPLPPAQTLAEAERLLAAGEPFRAHDLLEAAWKAADAAEAPLWQGLAQLAVGLTHRQRGNAAGAVALLRRGAGNIEAFAARPPHGVAVDALVRWAAALAAAIESGESGEAGGASAGAAGARPPLVTRRA